jgi:hypothetical protein
VTFASFVILNVFAIFILYSFYPNAIAAAVAASSATVPIETAIVEADVTRPFASIAKTGIVVAVPYVAAETPEVARVRDVPPVTSPVCVALVTLEVLAAIAVLIELANLSAVTASSAILPVVTCRSSICMVSIEPST